MSSIFKVGVVAFGSAIRELVAEEESFSNAGIITAPIYKFLAEKYDAHFYQLGPMQLKVKKALRQENDLYRPYLKNFHMIDNVSEEPDDLDLIIVQSGSENLRIAGMYCDRGLPCSSFVYRVLQKYLETPVLYTQTDFGAPFWFPESYHGAASVLHDSTELFAKRTFNILAAGTGEKAYVQLGTFYNVDELSKVHFLPPDMHFLIDLNNLSFKFDHPEHLLGIGFAGKARRFGSRETILYQYFEKVPMTLAGKWPQEYIDKFKSLNSSFKFIGKLATYNDVVGLYNTLGSTLFCSSPEYREAKSVTSRFYDAIHAKAIPFVHHEDIELVESVFGECRELVVTPDNIIERLDYFKDKEKRINLNNKLFGYYTKYHSNIFNSLDNLIKDLLKERGTINRDPNVIKHNMGERLRSLMKLAKRNKAGTVEEEDRRIAEVFDRDFYGKIDASTTSSKMMLGLFDDFPLKEKFNTIPYERVCDAVNFLNPKTIVPKEPWETPQ